MKFPRTKKLIFVNNKSGVGKTTLSFNCAVSLAEEGYKTVLVDLDPSLIADNQQGTKENIEKSREEFSGLATSLLKVLEAY